MVPPYNLLRGVYFLEHGHHELDVVCVEEPSLGVLFVFLEGDGKGVGNVYAVAVVLAEEDADDAFARARG